MGSITNADCKHAKRNWKDFGLQNLVQYLELYVQSDTLFLADIFERVRKKCLQIYKLDYAQIR